MLVVASFDRTYAQAYNHRIPQSALGHGTPIQELQKRRAEKPDLLSRRVNYLPGLDKYTPPPAAKIEAPSLQRIGQHKLKPPYKQDRAEYQTQFAHTPSANARTTRKMACCALAL